MRSQRIFEVCYQGYSELFGEYAGTYYISNRDSSHRRNGTAAALRSPRYRIQYGVPTLISWGVER